MFAPQQAQKSIFKIHQVMGGSRAGQTSGVASSNFIATGTLVSRSSSPHNVNIPKTQDNSKADLPVQIHNEKESTGKDNRLFYWNHDAKTP